MSLDELCRGLCRGELSRLILRRVVWQFKMSFPKKVSKTCHFCAINVSTGEGTVPLFFFFFSPRQKKKNRLIAG